MATFVTKCLVIRAYKYKEADKILVLLSPDRGKLKVVAKSVTKINSKLRPAAQVPANLNAEIWRSKSDLGRLIQAEVLDSFSGLYDDVSKLSATALILEVAERLSHEDMEAEDLYNLTLKVLKFIENKTDEPVFVFGAFAVKALIIEGMFPSIKNCAGCGGIEKLYYDKHVQGALCDKCGTPDDAGTKIYELLNLCDSNQINRAMALANQKEYKMAAILCEEYLAKMIESHIERELKSKKINLQI
jgi:DNA repair protein RecO (recombination protein O)